MRIRSFLKARYTLVCIVLSFLLVAEFIFDIISFEWSDRAALKKARSVKNAAGLSMQFQWMPIDSSQLNLEPDYKLIDYGRQLVAHTSRYLGPRGRVMHTSNGMNCQNCHLQAGTRPYGNNYSAVASTYPKFRARSGAVESVEKRVNDCIERSLNGTALDSSSKELKAMVAYIKWVGKSVEKGKIPEDAGLLSLPFLDRAASPRKGARVYAQHCERCHGANGEGQRSPETTEWTYPPLAGPNSYNTGAGLYRISKFAGFVKANMPFGVTVETTVLSDEEAWDVAAFVNSLPRPAKTFDHDWPDLSTKPFDHPFGPYADAFDEKRHKLGPFTWMKRQDTKPASK